MIVAGTIHPYDEETGRTSRRGIRMEFWRCANLFHLCTYVLADKVSGLQASSMIPLPTACWLVGLLACSACWLRSLGSSSLFFERSAERASAWGPLGNPPVRRGLPSAAFDSI